MTEEQTWTLLVCCCRGTSSFERDLTLEWESLPGKGRSAGEGKVQHSETERVDEAQRRKRIWRKPMELKHKYDSHRMREQEEEQNGRGREAEIKEQTNVLRVSRSGGWSTNREKSIQTTCYILKDSAPGDGEVTHHRESEEDREQDGSDERSHPNDRADAAEERSDAPTVYDADTRECQREVETG